jgi:hypothetical protein
LGITLFLGNSSNAIKTRIWSAVCVDVLMAMAKKKLGVNTTLYTFHQVLGLTLFRKNADFRGIRAAQCGNRSRCCC